MSTSLCSDSSSSAGVVGASLLVPPLLTAAYYLGTPQSMHWLWSEQGPLELSHVLIPLSVLGLGVATLAPSGRAAALRSAGCSWLVAAMLGLAVLCGVIAGEECSWGQHLFGWSTPDGWSELNDQQETNLHNIGSWADQKPRALVELSVIVFGIAWPVLDRLMRLRVSSKWRLVLPPAGVLPIALMAELVRLLERVPEMLGTRGWAAFPRPSEMQELYFYIFFALCMHAWRNRVHRVLELAGAPASGTTPQPQAPTAGRRAA